MKQCEGFPQVGCENAATNDMLGYELCDVCAENWRTHDTSEDQAVTIQQLRQQLATAHEALGEVSAILQQRNQDGWEARLLRIVNTALKGEKVG